MLALVLLLSLAHAGDDWITLDGAGDLPWRTSNQPLDAVGRPHDFYLPDAGFVGRTTKDKPDDLEIPGTEPGERRFLRYVNGELVDAWEVRQGSIGVTDFARLGSVEFKGAVLGPTTEKAEEGWRAVGDAISWVINDRTVLYWKDRLSNLEILVSRASPTESYGVRRATALVPGIPSKTNVHLTGDMNRWVKPSSREISGCFDNSPKPVQATIETRWDAEGRLARIRATADQPAVELTDCIAGAIAATAALPNQAGSFSLVRLQ